VIDLQIRDILGKNAYPPKEVLQTVLKTDFAVALSQAGRDLMSEFSE
jgi:hypothetical protein